MANARRSRRADVGALAGVLGIVMPGVGLLVLPIWQFPDTAATGAQIVAFVDAHRSALQTVMVLNTVGVSLWLVFGVRVWTKLRGTGTADLPAYFLVGCTVFVTLLLVGFTVFDILVYRTPEPGAARTLYDLTFGLLAMSGMPTAIALAAYSAAIHRRRILPAFTGHLATVTAAAHVALLPSFVVDRGFFSLQGEVITVIPGLLFAWIFVTSVALLRTDREDSAPGSQAPR